MDKPTLVPLTVLGKLVQIRPMQETDEAPLFSVLTDPETAKFLAALVTGDISIEPTIKHMAMRRKCSAEEESQGKSTLSIIVENNTGTLVGECGLHNINFTDKKAELGVIIHHLFWRKGYATEVTYMLLRYAFEELQFHRIAAVTHSSNHRMRDFFDAYGFHFEGIERETRRVGETYEDQAVYSLLEGEWPATKQRMEAKIERNPAQ